MPRLTLKDQSIFYTESRDALTKRPTLLLIHGAGGRHTDWPPHIRRLPGTNVYALDLPAHGKSSGSGRHTIIAYASDVLAFMDELGLQRPVIGGHSMGGAIAQTIALNHPDRLAALLLLATGARLRVRSDIMAGMSDDSERVVDLLIKLAYRHDTPQQQLRLGRKILLQVDPQVMQGDYTACNAFDVISRLAEIRVSTLIINGTADQLTPDNYARYLDDHIPNSQLALLEGGSHMIAIEAPDEVASLVDNWLGNLSTPQ